MSSIKVKGLIRTQGERKSTRVGGGLTETSKIIRESLEFNNLGQGQVDNQHHDVSSSNLHMYSHPIDLDKGA